MRLLRRLTPVVLAASASAAFGGPSIPGAVLLASDAMQPCVAIDDAGVVYVAFLQKGNVVVSVSKDHGATFGEPRIAIDAQGRAKGGRQRGPRIGVGAKGGIVVTSPLTFDDAEAKKRYPTPELYLTTSKDGTTWTPPVRVNEREKQAPEGLHALRVARDGVAHVAWLDRRDLLGNGQDLWYARVEGGKVGPNARVAEGVCECCAPGMALDGAGNPVLLWREGGDKQSREIFSARSSDGGAKFEKPRRVNTTPTGEVGCPMSAPAVAVTSDGKHFAAAWKDVRTGSPRVWWGFAAEPVFPEDAAVADDPKVDRDHPSLVLGMGDLFWIAWEEGRGDRQRVRARSTSDEGEIGKGAIVEVSDPSQGRAAFPVLATGGGLVVVVWESAAAGGSVHARVLEVRGW